MESPSQTERTTEERRRGWLTLAVSNAVASSVVGIFAEPSPAERGRFPGPMGGGSGPMRSPGALGAPGTVGGPPGARFAPLSLISSEDKISHKHLCTGVDPYGRYACCSVDVRALALSSVPSVLSVIFGLAITDIYGDVPRLAREGRLEALLVWSSAPLPIIKVDGDEADAATATDSDPDTGLNDDVALALADVEERDVKAAAKKARRQERQRRKTAAQGTILVEFPLKFEPAQGKAVVLGALIRAPGDILGAEDVKLMNADAFYNNDNNDNSDNNDNNYYIREQIAQKAKKALSCWNFKIGASVDFSETPLNDATIASAMSEEQSVIWPLISNQKFQGCVSLADLVSKSLSVSRGQNKFEDLDGEIDGEIDAGAGRESAGGGAGVRRFAAYGEAVKRWEAEGVSPNCKTVRIPGMYNAWERQLSLPFDRIFLSLKNLNQRLDVSDFNTRQLAVAFQSLKTETEMCADDFALLQHLIARIETLEELLLDLTVVDANRSKRMTEMIDMAASRQTDHEDFSYVNAHGNGSPDRSDHTRVLPSGALSGGGLGGGNATALLGGPAALDGPQSHFGFGGNRREAEDCCATQLLRDAGTCSEIAQTIQRLSTTQRRSTLFERDPFNAHSSKGQGRGETGNAHAVPKEYTEKLTELSLDPIRSAISRLGRRASTLPARRTSLGAFLN